MIPEAAVEAAAKVTFEGLFDLDASDGWEYLTPSEREPYEHQARTALEAAAPHMADSWHDAVSEAYVEGSLSADQANIMWNKNPYRAAR